MTTTETKIRNIALTEKIYSEIVNALAQEFVPLFAQMPTLISVAWSQDPHHYNDEVHKFAAFTEEYLLDIHDEDYEKMTDPELQKAELQASQILQAFDDQLLMWLHKKSVTVTITRDGITFGRPSDNWQ